MLATFFIFQAAFGLSTKKCKELRCSNGPTRGNCIEDKGDYILVSPCVDGLKCDLYSLYSVTTNWTTVPCVKDKPLLDLCEDYKYSLYSGQLCCVSSNCFSKQCTNDRCEGNQPGSYCIVDDQCTTDYFCKNNQCITAIQETCTRDNGCQVGYGCNNTACLQFFTIDLNDYSEKDAFCKTNYVYNGRCDAIQVFVNGVALNSSRICHIGDMCEYYTVNDKIPIKNESCMCAGIPDSTIGYCGLYANKSIDMIPIYESIQYSTSFCSGDLSSSYDPEQLYTCGSIDFKHYQYGKIMNDRYDFFNLYMSHALDHCARPLGLFDPWYDPTVYTWGRSLLFTSTVLLAYY